MHPNNQRLRFTKDTIPTMRLQTNNKTRICFLKTNLSLPRFQTAAGLGKELRGNEKTTT